MSAWTEVPELRGEHVRLVPLERRHRDAIVAALADQSDQFTTFVPAGRTVDAWYATLEREIDAGRTRAFTVFDSAGVVCGVTRYMRMSEEDRRLEIGGTVYARRVQRTGVNTEAKLLLLNHAFEVMGCLTVQLRTDWLNAVSRAAIERLGAKCDGVLRGHRVMPDRHIRDTVVYSIIASEWPGVRSNLRHRLRPPCSEPR
jgi:RimJ/RimL family protein N-acetyltransferase